tara:strand:+ start:58848 stop:59312 length:465 start_codon:yes stop_codon:yes gene_type:complete
MAAPINSPLQPIITSSQGRVNQLEPGVGLNQQARASDFNAVVAYLNARAGVNKTTATSASNTPTINAVAGKFTSATLTTSPTGGTGSPVTALTITNNTVTTDSIVIAQITTYGGTTGAPVIAKIAPGSGSIVLTIANVGVAVLNGAVTITFIVL